LILFGKGIFPLELIMVLEFGLLIGLGFFIFMKGLLEFLKTLLNLVVLEVIAL
jgi:hypothetical protein